ncbi:MAG TPA: PepSY domain-containing protein [Caulobacteraceae bacterium]|nr:PepSY domain-containing protein [Caulobacteraceae bacterium]
MSPTLASLISAAVLVVALAGSAGAAPPGAAVAGPATVAPRPNSLGANWAQQQDEVKRRVRRRQLVPMRVVIARIRRLNPGPRSQQLDAGLEYRGSEPVYRVRWMTNDGRRIDYIVDAATGKVLSGG